MVLHSHLEEHVTETAELWQSRAMRLACSGLYPRFYLYYVERDGLRLATEDETPDPSWQLATPESIGCGMDYRRVRRFIREKVGRLPILHDAAFGGSK